MQAKIASLALIAMLLLGSAVSLAAERGAHGRSRSFIAIGSLTLSHTVGDGRRVEVQADAWVPARPRTDATCPYFAARRRGGETTVSATCFPDSSGQSVRVLFKVESILWDGHSGVGIDGCTKRAELPKDPVDVIPTPFKCTVTHSPPGRT